MKSLYIEEYDKTGNLVFIVDRRTGRGFHVKRNLTSQEKEELFSSLENEEVNKKPLSESWINRIFNFNREVSSVGISKVLLTTYVSLLACIGFLAFLNNSIFRTTQVSYTKEGLTQLLIGFGVFIIGVIFIHELSHILVARLQGIYVKKVGFRIRYFIFPIFYVRIFPTSNRQKKINIAFVGLVSDLLLLVIYSSSYLIFNSAVLKIALTYQTIMALYNYNVLLPTDFANTLFQFFNIGNFRVEAFEYSKHLFSRKGSTNELHQSLPPKKKILYITYTILFTVLWVAVVIAFVLQTIKSSQMR